MTGAIRGKIGGLALIVLASGGYAQASQAGSFAESQIELVEQQTASQLRKADRDPAKRFALLMHAAGEAYRYRFYEKSFGYYWAAIGIDVNADKSRAYLGRIAISVLAKDQARILDALNQAKRYFDDNPQLKTGEIAYYLGSIEKSLPGQTAPAHVGGLYGAYVDEQNFRSLLRGKQYRQAFAMLDPQGVKQSDDSFHVTAYDLLNLLLNGKSVKELYCNREYSEWPNAYTYSTLICGLLNDYLQTGKFSDKKMRRAERYFAEEDRERSFLLEMVKELH